MNAKNIVISVCAVAIIGLIFFFQSGTGKKTETRQKAAATSTQEAATSTPAAQPQPEKPKSGLNVHPGVFHYDITAGKTPCGDKIGSFAIESAISGEKLYWALDGMKPLWMNLSSTWGETPARVDMTYTCILSGASSDKYQIAFDVNQTNKDGSKIAHKYLFAVVMDGNITLENR